jgi:hypothetical protein
MAYWDRPTSTSTPSIDSVSLTKNRGGGTQDAFYEIEPAVVLDIILDKNHPYLKKNPFTINPDRWPVDISGVDAKKTDPDYTWVGRASIRLLFSQRNIEKDDLIWAIPLDANPAEYPVLNEVVGVVSYLGQYYYTRRINTSNWPNVNADFNLELTNGGFHQTENSPVEGNRELRATNTSPFIPFQGPQSKLRRAGGTSYQGALGRYFFFNPKIRSLKRYEGDHVIESRFGQSIRFAAYDNNRDNDKGTTDTNIVNSPYKVDASVDIGIGGTLSGAEKSYVPGPGNPMILIRNRQRQPTNVLEEKNVGGYIVEDINKDGSSIHMTSGLTTSEFKTTCLKKMWGNGEEQSGFDGTTQFKYPKLMGDQIVINSDRLVLSSKTAETFHYSKKRYAVVTDDEYTVDAHNQMVFTTNNKTVFNSPAIYLGEYDQTAEPAVLGQTTVNWLYELCNWLLEHTHWYKHTHPDAGQANPDKTQLPVQVERLKILRDNLQSILSRRVFLTGGGYAPGQNGENLG